MAQHMTRGGSRPWWLAEETSCSCCLLRHAMLLEVRCRDCGQAVCRTCAVFVSRAVLCPGCAPRGEA